MQLVLVLLLVVVRAWGGSSFDPWGSAYVANFDQAYVSTMNVSDRIPWGMFRRIIISFATLNQSGHIYNERPTDHARILHIMSLYRRARPDGQVFISLFGTVNVPYVEAAGNPTTFVQSVMSYLKRYNMTGLDLDWETQVIDAYSDQLVALLKACHQAFQGRYLLTHAIWPNIHSPQTVAKLHAVLDEINIMSYYMSVEAVKQLVTEYYQHGFPYHQMVIGMETESGLESREIIAGKLALVQQLGLAGYFEWRLDNDGIPVAINGTNAGPPTFKTTKTIYDVLMNWRQPLRRDRQP